MPAYQLSIWSAIFAPKGTPKPIVAKLSDALNKALDDPAVGKRLADLGGTVPPKAERGPEYLGKALKADIALGSNPEAGDGRVEEIERNTEVNLTP